MGTETYFTGVSDDLLDVAVGVFLIRTVCPLAGQFGVRGEIQWPGVGIGDMPKDQPALSISPVVLTYQ